MLKKIETKKRNEIQERTASKPPWYCQILCLEECFIDPQYSLEITMGWRLYAEA